LSTEVKSPEANRGRREATIATKRKGEKRENKNKETASAVREDRLSEPSTPYYQHPTPPSSSLEESKGNPSKKNDIRRGSSGLRSAVCEGHSGLRARHSRVHASLRSGLPRMGIGYLADPDHQLPMLNAVASPEGVDEAGVRQRLLEKHSIEIGGGLGEFKGKAWRIGLMGESATDRHVGAVLSALASEI